MATEDRDTDRRPQPPKAGRDSICDTCGRSEDDCRRTPEAVSGHTFTPKHRLTTQPPPPGVGGVRDTIRNARAEFRTAHRPDPPPRPTPREPDPEPNPDEDW